jgi:phosphoglycerate dehydrogenase-like enzyme
MLLLDEPCDKAKEIFSIGFDFLGKFEQPDIIYTGLTPVETTLPVCCPCTGIDHVKSPHIIHLDDAWKRGDGVMVTSTAEHTWSLLMQLAKLKRIQLSSKTIGIIGYGRIGKQVRRYAESFGIYFYACDTWTCPEDRLRLLKESDIITIHVPLNDETKGMIGKSEFDQMKDGALLTNTSRAKIVNEDALVEALNSGKLGGYADDFYMDHVVDVTEHPNVILTNHIAGNCIEAREYTDTYIAYQTLKYWRTRSHD